MHEFGGVFLSCLYHRDTATAPSSDDSQLLYDPIQLGICAIGMIDRMIYCGAYPNGTAIVFRDFKLWTR